MNTEVRDRPYVRLIHIRKEDRERFLDFLSTIPRDTVLFRIGGEDGNHLLYNAKLKKQELLYIELAFKVVVKKPKKCKKV